MDPSPRPPDRLDVDLQSVSHRGQSRIALGPVVALAAVVAVIGASVALAQAFPVEERVVVATPLVAVTSPAAPVAATETPSAAAPAVPAPAVAARIDRQSLVSRVLDGSLAGWLVYADAEVRMDCPTGTGARCSALPPRIVGLPLEAPGGDVPDVRLDPVPPRAVLVLRVDGAGFEYEGSLIADPDGSPSLATLDAEERTAAPTDARPSLHDAAGWLVQAGPCLEPPSAFEPCPRHSFLADDQPIPNRSLRTQAGTWVRIADDAWGINPPFDPVLSGPFLVRRLSPETPDDPGWEIVARYDSSRSVRVVIP